MAEALGAAGSIDSIAAYGLQLATSLQTYEQGYSSAEENLCELGVDISATASALLQLQHVIESDKDLSTKVLKDEGVQEIENVAVQCEKIYKTVITLVNKAGKSANKGRVAADFGDKPVLKPSNLLWDMRSKWLDPRVKRIQEQIRWVKMKVLLNLQLAGLAKVQLGIPERAPGSFNEELALRLLASRIRRREVKYLEKLATKYRIREMLGLDSPYNASVLSIPDYVPPPVPIPESEPAGFRGGPSNNEPSSNPFRPGPPGPPVFMGDRVTEIHEDTPAIPPERPPTAPGSKDGPTKIINVVMPSPKVAASISRSNTMVPDQQSERGAADLEEAASKIEVEEVKPVKPASEIPSIAPRKELAVKKDDKPKEDATSTEESTEAIAMPPLPGSQQSFFPAWLRGIFGQTNKFSNDWESQTLEAFIIPENSTGLLKVPFGHQSLAEGLRRVKKQCLPWDQYTALGSQHHKRINKAVLEAKRLDSRERTCVAVGLNKEYGAERIMLFFLVGGPVEPIHLKDAVGRKYTFPYEQARTWPLMKGLIDAAFLNVDGLGSQVNKAQYDLINEEGKIVLPEVYEQLVKPGSSISQHMWPMLMPPGPFNRRPAGPGMPPGPPPASNLPNNFNNLPPPPAAAFPLGPPRPPGGVPPPGPTNNFCGPAGGPGGPPVIVNLCRGPPGSRLRSRSRSRHRPPPPGVLGWMAGTKSEDSSFLAEDPDIKDEPEDLGLEIDFDKEDVNAKLSLGDLLAKLTNATDTVHDFLSDDEDSSDDDSSSGTGSSRSLVSD